MKIKYFLIRTCMALLVVATLGVGSISRTSALGTNDGLAPI